MSELIEKVRSYFTEMSPDELSESHDILAEEMRERAYNAWYSEGYVAGRMAMIGGAVEVDKSMQTSRDEIVEMAKRDIEDLKNGGLRYGVGIEGFYAEFIVNREKRTVVVLLRGHLTGMLKYRGIAKCDPNDCFNEHIGKAIALRRAMGHAIPDEYLNAPQPTEVRKGDVINCYKDGEFTFKHTLVSENDANEVQPEIDQCINGYRSFIIDDSRD